MDILFSTDYNYLKQTSIAIKSVCVNNKDENICFHIIVDETMSNDDCNRIAAVLDKSDSTKSIKFYPIHLDDEKMNHYPGLGGKQHQTKACYYRILVCEILPANLSKVLYLDDDVIVRGSLKSLWNLDITNVAIAVTPDGNEGAISFYNRLEYSVSLGYFNSGVMLINLDYWRSHNVQQRCLDFMNCHKDRVRIVDQDVLNYVLREEKALLPLEYNVQTLYLRKKEYHQLDYTKYKDQLDKAINNPVIIHFIGKKPWEPGCRNPYRNLFKQYQDMTEWKGQLLISGKNYLRLWMILIGRKVLVWLRLHNGKSTLINVHLEK